MSDVPAADTAEIETAGLDAPRPQRPENVPEKFWDSDAGGLRADALLKSYLELERKLGTGSREPEPVAAPTAAAAPSEAGEENAAETPEIAPPPSSFTIASPHPLIEPDPQLNERLLGAGFSQSQAQLVYDLAAERLLPVIREALGEIEAQHQLERLQRHFGGADSWRNTARQLKSWASSQLDPAIHETLAASYEGVLALHQMIRASEPELLGGGAAPAAEPTQEALVEMMRDPRYWRQRDPEFIARVTAGFKRLYAD